MLNPNVPSIMLCLNHMLWILGIYVRPSLPTHIKILLPYNLFINAGIINKFSYFGG